MFADNRRQRGTWTLVLAGFGSAVVAGLARPRLGPPWDTTVFVAGLVATVALLGWAAARGWPAFVAWIKAGEERARQRGW